MHLLLLLLAIPLFAGTLRAEIKPGDLSKFQWTSADSEHKAYVYVPKALPERDIPLVVTFHGSRRRGHQVVLRWIELAEREKVIVVGPDSVNPVGWAMPDDAPEPIYDLVETLKELYPIDPNRVYLFGQSAGGVHVLLLGMMEPGYFAAVASHGAALPQAEGQIPVVAEERKPPILMLVGTEDPHWRPEVVHHTRDVLVEHHFPIELKELVGHGHGYDGDSRQINQMVWEFLKDKKLDFSPYYTVYDFVK